MPSLCIVSIQGVTLYQEGILSGQHLHDKVIKKKNLTLDVVLSKKFFSKMQKNVLFYISSFYSQNIE